MIKDLKNLYVLNVIKPLIIFRTTNFKDEEVKVLRDLICRKEKDENQNIIYRDLEIGSIFEVNGEIGKVRVAEESIVPLSRYYNVFGMPKINFSYNTKNVRGKVKILKKQNKL